MPLGDRARSIAVLSLSAAIAVAVLARGGVDPSTQVCLLAATCTALVAASFVSTARFQAPALVVALTAGTGAILLQLVPLPPAVLAAVSPAASDVAQVALLPLGLYPAARPVTLDVPATAGELGKAAMLLAAATAAALVATRRRSRDVLIAVVSMSGVAALAVLVGGALATGTPVLGRGGPFVNANHLAAFLSLAAWPALGRAMREKGVARAGWLSVFAGAGAGTMLTLSRAGIAAFLVGAAVFALLQVRRELHARRREGEARAGRRLQHGSVLIAATLALGAASYVALDPILEEIRSAERVTNDPRTEIWAAAVAMLGKHPLLGIGRGAFETAFPGYERGSALPATHTHAENEWLQIPLELGVPLGLAFIVALVWTWLSAARRRDLSRVEIGALSGTAAVAAHAVFDFALELPGVALPFAVLLAAVTASGKGWSLRPTTFRAAAVGLFLAGAAGLALSSAHPLERASALGASPVEDVPELARSLAWWRPADYLPHAAAGASLAQAGRCGEAMPWLRRAMWLAPFVPEPHRHAARCLAAAGQETFARIEYRLALMLGDGSALQEAVLQWSGADRLLALVPETADAIARLANHLERTGRRAEAAEVLARAWDSLSDRDLLFRLAQMRYRLGEQRRALDLATELRALEPDRSRSYVLSSMVMRSLGDRDGARRELEAGLKRSPGSPELVLALGTELIAEKQFARAIQVLTTATWRSANEAARGRQLVIAALRAQGRLVEATREARIARDLDPRNVALNLRLADLLAETGLHHEAVAILTFAATLPGADGAAIAVRLEKMQSARVRGSEPADASRALAR